MPDRRNHRGPHPEDATLFAPAVHERLRNAAADLCWLLSRDYAIKSSLKIVGDRYALRERQRLAVLRSTCSAEARDSRSARESRPQEVAGQRLLIDGYNVLTTVEAASANGFLFLGCDGCLRDLASVHGTYRKVTETVPALTLLGEVFEELEIQQCEWFLDQPVSNSGRLKAVMLETASARGWNWNVSLVMNPDRVLAQSAEIIATADSVILDRCVHWFNLARYAVSERVPHARIIDLVPVT